MCCYAYLSDEQVPVHVTFFDVIVNLITMVIIVV